ncbi:WD40/YVTN/BNR-like repeat-containing protein [Halomontanus rarus]|uniref:WD40/YVTN/BNR-like repeat-containing protein n=1 Tax=Halomontanus rarus TaxID=3034020 RepID=UPI0023E76468|nr:hypothetical protein [Halovivax sp. TS33]
MIDSPVSRRRFLATLGLASVPFAGCSGTGSESEWVLVDTPTDATLTDVVTASTGTFAVGEGGVVLRRGREMWSIALADGPTGAQNGLESADVTSNGRVVWFAGDSGALGAYDTVDETVLDVSAPEGWTSSWEALAVTGLAGGERLFLINSSGAFLRGRRDGSDVEWREPTEPGTGTSVAAMAVTPLEYGYVCDTSGDVYESADAGETWTRIGIEGASVNFHDVSAVDSGHVDVAGGDGVVYRYDGGEWSRTVIGEDPIRAIARDRYDALVVDSLGRISERTFDGWVELDRVDTGNEPLGIALGTPRTPQVVVGESGTVLERRY